MTTKPSLALIPSAYKASKVYSVLPNDGTGDFDFSRATTATRINEDGLIETVGSNIPRLNYPMIDGVVSGCPSLLLEPSRTNLMANSEDISAWSSFGSLTKTLNIDVSLDGSQTADGIEDTTGAGFNYIYQQGSCSPNSTHTGSIFVKKVSSETNFMGVVLLYTGVTSKIAYGIINSVEGTIVNSSSTITPTFKVDDYGNYWRFSITATDTGSNTLCKFGVYATLSNNGTTLGTGISSIRTIWGAQLEQGSYPTSYIPTQGSTVTRVAETCTGAGDASTFNDSEGVLYAEISALANDLTQRAISINDGTDANQIAILYNNVSNQLRVIVSSSGFDKTFVTDITENHKIALKYKVNNFALWVDGIKVESNTSGAVFSEGTLTNMSFDFGAGVIPFYGNTKQIQYFDSALNDTDLEELTSWKSFNEMARDLLYTIQ